MLRIRCQICSWKVCGGRGVRICVWRVRKKGDSDEPPKPPGYGPAIPTQPGALARIRSMACWNGSWDTH